MCLGSGYGRVGHFAGLLVGVMDRGDLPPLPVSEMRFCQVTRSCVANDHDTETLFFVSALHTKGSSPRERAIC